MKKLLTLLIVGYLLLGISQKAQAQGSPLRANITATTNVACNGGNTASSTIAATGGISPYTYSWNPGNQTNATATGLTAGTYTIMVTDNVASTATTSVAITQPTTLYYSTATSNVSCWGQYSGTAGTTGIGGTPPYTYNWSNGGSTSTITGLSAGTFTMTLTDANGCTAQTNTSITQPPQLVVTYSSVASFVTASVSGGTAPYSYSWNPPVSTSAVAYGLSAGTYTISVKDAHVCSDSALVNIGSPRVATDTTITFTFANAVTTCGSPQYFEFDVMVSSNLPSWFNACTIFLPYNSAAFGTYIFTNGNVTVTTYSNFSLPTYVAPQYNDDGPDTLVMGFGTNGNQNPLSRTQIDTTPQPLFHVKIKIQSCNVPANIAFTDSTHAHESFSVNQNDVASLGIEYNHSYFAGSINDTLCRVIITSYTNPINAGTNNKSKPANSSILNITGSGFGVTQGAGYITVPDANTGGTGTPITLDNTDILLWSDTKIVVRMPSAIYGNPNVTPGSGNLVVVNNCGIFANNPLTINYSIEDTAILPNEKLRKNIAMERGDTSLLFRCDTSISNHPLIYAVVLQAVETWNCYTGVNWHLGLDTTLEVSTNEGVSLIYFTNSLASNVPMHTDPHIDLSCNNGGDSMAFVYDADIEINRTLPSGYTWNYNTSDTVFHGGLHRVYFFDALMHELGHAHLLNHVDDPTSLMWWQVDTNSRKTILSGPQDLYAGFDVVSTDSAFSNSCKYGTLKNVPRVCIDHSLDVPAVLKNGYSLNLYPNPASNGNITIGYTLTNSAYIQFKVTDCVGRVMTTLPEENEPPGTHSKQLNVSGWAQGVYLFIANINGELKTIKFIKL